MSPIFLALSSFSFMVLHRDYVSLSLQPFTTFGDSVSGAFRDSVSGIVLLRLHILNVENNAPMRGASAS